ncbi:MAG TPA: thiamine pyrophosphate-binding protein [Anaeromyxobacter sp.]|nr:thiamine pyrophosphate-binding protein [Anaeromyxobacter sp.]
MRVADHVMSFLAERGVAHAFLVTGGGSMHLNDALGRERRIRWQCCHHEQACAIAAESYARLSGRVALVNVTTGPGGVNALNGVYGAWVDSIPMVVVSGQVKRETIAGNTGLPLRQLGDQEIDIVAMARSVTKYAVCVQDPGAIRYHLEKAWHLATTGRPGPVWIDVPIDVQAAQIEPSALKGFSAEEEGGGRPLALRAEAGATTGEALEPDVRDVVARLSRAERPVLLAGAGVRLAGGRELLLRVAERLGVPLTTGWNAHDLVPNAHPCYAGRPGSLGDRQGNFTVQNADFLLVLGSRLNIRQVSYNWKTFARAAYRVMVDVDLAELEKPTLSVDRPVHADVREFLDRLDRATAAWRVDPRHAAWMAWCRARGERYPVVVPEYERAPRLSPYVFMRDLFDALPEDATVVTGDGTACVVSFQAGRIKSGTRLYTNSGCASMGYDVPAAIGAHVASGRRVFCLAGDGSVMMNLQELQTIAGARLPVVIFVLNNDGYASIRQTQRAYFPGNAIGIGPDSGVTFPDFVRLADALGIPARRCASGADVAGALDFALRAEGPALVEVVLDPDAPFAPKLASRALPDGRMVSPALEDMAPFLPREELAENLLIPPLE